MAGTGEVWRVPRSDRCITVHSVGVTQTRPIVTVSQAADLCLVSRKSITRRLPALMEHGATKDSMGQWAIPVLALMAVGLKPGKPNPPDPKVPVIEVDAAAEVQRWQHRAELAEARAEERERTIEVLRMALRQLETRPAGSPVLVPDPLVSQDGDLSPVPLVATGQKPSSGTVTHHEGPRDAAAVSLVNDLPVSYMAHELEVSHRPWWRRFSRRVDLPR